MTSFKCNICYETKQVYKCATCVFECCLSCFLRIKETCPYCRQDFSVLDGDDIVSLIIKPMSIVDPLFLDTPTPPDSSVAILRGLDIKTRSHLELLELDDFKHYRITRYTTPICTRYQIYKTIPYYGPPKKLNDHVLQHHYLTMYLNITYDCTSNTFLSNDSLHDTYFQCICSLCRWKSYSAADNDAHKHIKNYHGWRQKYLPKFVRNIGTDIDLRLRMIDVATSLYGFAVGILCGYVLRERLRVFR